MVRSIKRSLPRRELARREAGKRESRARSFRVKAMDRGEEPGGAAPVGSPAYGERNVQKVTAGTGEALPGPGVRNAPGEPTPHKR